MLFVVFWCVQNMAYLKQKGDMDMQALMLAAGMGRRMGKYTEAMTKCMMQVGGRT